MNSINKLSLAVSKSETKTTHRSALKSTLSVLIAIASAVVLSACGDGRTDTTAFQQAIESLGGQQALQELESFQVSATGTRRISYESPIPASEMDEATFEATNGGLEDLSDYSTTASFDFTTDSFRLDTTRTQRFEIFEIIYAGNDPTFSMIINGQQGYLNAPAAFSPPGPIPSHIVAALRVQQQLLNPIIYLLDGQDDPDLIEEGGPAVLDGRTHRTLTFADNVAPVVIYVDDETGFISKIETTENSMLVRDVDVEVFYSDWQVYDAIAFPNEVDIYIDGGLVTEETRTAVVIEPELAADTFELPADMPAVNDETYAWGEQTHQNIDAFLNMGFYFQENRPEVDTTVVAPNLTMYGRFPIVNINNFVLEHSGGVIVMEAGATGESGDDLVARVTNDFPGQNITHIVQSHFHLDHASGVRSIVAAGATLVVGNGVRSFWEGNLAKSSTIRPDTLSLSNVTPEIIEVGLNESLVLVDEAGLRFTVYHTSLFDHAADTLLATVETDGQIFLFESDFYNPGLVGPNPAVTVITTGPAQLFNAMRAIGVIDADCNSALPLTIIPAHGSTQSLADAIVQIENTPGNAGATGCS